MEGPSAKRRDLTGSRSRLVCFIWNGIACTSLMPFCFLRLAGRLGPGAGEREGRAGPRRGEPRERGARSR